MKKNTCAICNDNISFLWKIYSQSTKHNYNIYQCKNCKVRQINPIPDSKETRKLYQKEYFQKRSDRGYNNYESTAVKKTIIRTVEKNLNDLNFYSWEKLMPDKNKLSLDIGCAAGYFVEYLKNRNWQAEGIDIASQMTNAAKKKQLTIYNADFLKKKFPSLKYNLVTLWASIEHLENPSAFLNKINKILKPNGKLYLSTCHLGFFARIKKKNWRYLNVPEHIWFFTRKSLKELAKTNGFSMTTSFTYGSGFTTKENAGFFYKFLKIIFDSLAKQNHMGDMIVCEFIKNK
ncbi:MAG: class I SAM-dependent methyltransferase [Spirochaetia bacterium]|nr:class I SAM-dependent methyltransferase [Spirochaetia bacterium]